MVNTPSDWKNYEDFAAGIDTNRIPQTEALRDTALTVSWETGRQFTVKFTTKHSMRWEDERGAGDGWYEAIEVAPHTYFLDMTFNERKRDALTLIVNVETLRTLSILSHVRPEPVVGEPQVTQTFTPGVLSKNGKEASGMVPAPSRDLIGKRTWQRYSPNHLYEHTYLSSQRYCWQCLIGEQRGHGDVDLSTTYKFADNLYLFTFREFKIAVASVFFFNFDSMRSTGKFLGIKGNGEIENNAAGAYMKIASVTEYERGAEPV
ncbi:MAG: MoaF C-terminal domain-containing protein [Desulfopila sp.]